MKEWSKSFALVACLGVLSISWVGTGVLVLDNWASQSEVVVTGGAAGEPDTPGALGSPDTPDAGGFPNVNPPDKPKPRKWFSGPLDLLWWIRR